MSNIVGFFQAPGMTQAQYDAIMAELHSNPGFPDKALISHTAWQDGDTWCVVDVWESQEAFMNFGQQMLFPIFGKLGISVPPPQVFPLHNRI